ncbi:MAG: fppS [Frankiales bacterium]|nr:fppS [Frankiales bacterium]
MTSSLPAALTSARDLVGPALRRAVEQLPSPMIRKVAGYHLGWLDEDGAERPGDSGKALRPALAVLSAQAVSAPAAVAVPAGIAVELVHNFSLLHDDLMDGDTERRHRATAWTLYGDAAAILAGDALLALAQQVLFEVEGDRALQASRRLTNATQELIRGQVEDLAFERRGDVAVAEVMSMVAGKTAALLACSAALGAVLAGAPPAAVAALDAFGHELGMAFQLVDDLLGIWGHPEVTGKPVLADLRARKKSVPVVVALNADGASADRLRAIFAGGGPEGEEDVALAAKLIEDAGGRDWTAREARARLDCAIAELEAYDFEPTVRADLEEVARFVASREL